MGVVKEGFDRWSVRDGTFVTCPWFPLMGGEVAPLVRRTLLGHKGDRTFSHSSCSSVSVWGSGRGRDEEKDNGRI